MKTREKANGERKQFKTKAARIDGGFCRVRLVTRNVNPNSRKPSIVPIDASLNISKTNGQPITLALCCLWNSTTKKIVRASSAHTKHSALMQLERQKKFAACDGKCALKMFIAEFYNTRIKIISFLKCAIIGKQRLQSPSCFPLKSCARFNNSLF